LDDKTFYSNEDVVKISYGYISSANTYGITTENAKGASFYYINCNIRAYGSFCDINGMSPGNWELAISMLENWEIPDSRK
jgi:hypothetical protein